MRLPGAADQSIAQEYDAHRGKNREKVSDDSGEFVVTQLSEAS
jgi:hypothetical protein